MALKIETLEGSPEIDFGELAAADMAAGGRWVLSAPGLGLIQKDLRKVASPGVTDGMAVINNGFRGREIEGCVLMYTGASIDAVQDLIDADMQQIADSNSLVKLTMDNRTAPVLMNYVIVREFRQTRDVHGRLMKGGSAGAARGYVMASFFQFALG